MELGKFFNLVKDRIGMADLGVLKVAMMVAAIDGDIMDSELEAFELMAKRCRGYSPESYAAALKEAMHAAGYLMIAMKRDTETEFVKEFIVEAKAALPNGFANLPIEDIRLAVVTWISIAISDGDYSRRERKCIEALRRNFAEIKVRKAIEEEARWLAISPVLRQATAKGGRTVELVAKDFTTMVENLIAKYGDVSDAVRELKRQKML